MHVQSLNDPFQDTSCDSPLQEVFFCHLYEFPCPAIDAIVNSIMKKLLSQLLLLTCFQHFSSACTCFLLHKNGQLVFGRNYDWITGNGMVCTNQRGLAKTSSKTKDGATISWISKYGSITFNQYGKEFPTGGMNEKGLVVELMWLDGSIYPKADGRPAVGVLQWIQYQLDNCSTVEELIATDSKLRIASDDTAPLHYLVADAGGNAATIEFLDGKMVVHQNKELPFPVLTNDRYDASLQQSGAEAGNRYNFTSNSIERFAKACKGVRDFDGKPGTAVDHSFSILDDVAQGSHTKWSIVYDIANRKVWFKTLGFTQVKNIAFSDFDFSCSAPAKAWDMNQSVAGPVARLFHDHSSEMNRQLVTRSFRESSSQIRVREGEIRETWQYPEGISCPKTAPAGQQ